MVLSKTDNERAEWYPSMKDRIIHLTPILIIFIGVLIHFKGFFTSIGTDKLTDWELWVHISMLMIDSTLIIGLMKRGKWAYILALLLFIQQTGTQIFFVVRYMLGYGDYIPQIINILTIVAGTAVTVVMIVKHSVFVNNRYSR